MLTFCENLEMVASMTNIFTGTKLSGGQTDGTFQRNQGELALLGSLTPLALLSTCSQSWEGHLDTH